MQELICKAHATPLTLFCGSTGCSAPLLCLRCIREHDSAHTAYFIPLEELVGVEGRPNALYEGLSGALSEGENLLHTVDRAKSDAIKTVEAIFADISKMVNKKLDEKKTEAILMIRGPSLEAELNELRQIRNAVKKSLAGKMEESVAVELTRLYVTANNDLIPRMHEKMQAIERGLSSGERIELRHTFYAFFEKNISPFIESIDLRGVSSQFGGQKLKPKSPVPTFDQMAKASPKPILFTKPPTPTNSKPPTPNAKPPSPSEKPATPNAKPPSPGFLPHPSWKTVEVPNEQAFAALGTSSNQEQMSIETRGAPPPSFLMSRQILTGSSPTRLGQFTNPSPVPLPNDSPSRITSESPTRLTTGSPTRMLAPRTGHLNNQAGSTNRRISHSPGKAPQTCGGDKENVGWETPSFLQKKKGKSTPREEIRLWRSQKAHDIPARVVVFLPMDAKFVTAGDDRVIKVWDATGEKNLSSLKGHSSPITAVIPLGDDGNIASADSSGLIVVWHRLSWPVLRVQVHEGEVGDMAYLPAEQLIVSGGKDWEVRTTSATAGSITNKWRVHKDAITAVVVGEMRDKAQFATAGLDKTIRLWTLKCGCIRTVDTGAHIPRSLLFVEDVSAIFAGCQDGTLKILAGKATSVDSFKAHSSTIVRLAHIKKTQRFITMDRNGTIKLWKLDTPIVRGDSLLTETNNSQGEITSGSLLGNEPWLLTTHANGMLSWNAIDIIN
eukprot:TRINITY_DN8765_c0_g1_i1.p1 TRINITY_DN8765_c0_g1~~TRINITY_DN8765_c0_g1_i1.p1  ORF type:complete len:724 (-),score=98.77 TRINITY_DN8765_c0_g1_i1:64-2235(-)